MTEPCMCGRPIPDTANLCPRCADVLRDNLHKIADRWAELEDALMWRETLPGAIGVRHDDGPSDIAHGERKLPLATGTDINLAAVNARRKATDVVWFMLQVVRDDLDNAGRPFTPPRLHGNRSQDHTPLLARWLASWHVSHFTHRTERESAEEVASDLERAERAVYHATHPKGERWVPVNLVCDQWGTSEEGERVPCMGEMWAYVGRDVTPDLVCNVDQSHTIEPGLWERAGWKRKHKDGLHPNGVAALMERIR